MSGELNIITGCMYSGKTSELIRRIEREKIANRNIAVLTPDIDDRYGKEYIGSHNGNKILGQNTTTDPEEIYSSFMSLDADVIAIDEGNLFPEEIVRPVQELVDQGKTIHIAGLDRQFNREPFNPMEILMAKADEVMKLTAVCSECGDDATLTQRLVDGSPANPDDDVIQVGSEEYHPRCRDCHKL